MCVSVYACVSQSVYLVSEVSLAVTLLFLPLFLYVCMSVCLSLCMFLVSGAPKRRYWSTYAPSHADLCPSRCHTHTHTSTCTHILTYSYMYICHVYVASSLTDWLACQSLSFKVRLDNNDNNNDNDDNLTQPQPNNCTNKTKQNKNCTPRLHWAMTMTT